MGLITDAANILGGTAREFDQTVAIKAAGWGSSNVSNRGGAWVSGNGLAGGVCQGLILLYIANRGDWDAFLTKFVSSSGMAMVRGAMNLNLEADRTGGFGRAVWSNFRDMLSRFVKAFGGTTFSGSYVQANDGTAAQGAAKFAKSKPGLYHLLIYGDFGGHSLGIVNRGPGSTVSFFDPNFGELTLPDKAELSNFTQWLLSNNYSGI
ncbi:MAG TPA: YopT-type cysteine protease domain-containing protein [Acidobacteriaceae bacterium]|jgi:hypothetical protein|nr:YopT-type cysteine protease domain-containing protein [Acidobacteriaceae bacterium]